MNTTAPLNVPGDKPDRFGAPQASDRNRGKSGAAAGTALWIFMGVAGSLFSLFLASYVMRMDGNDWRPIVMPWQLWFSTMLLAAGSATLQLASPAARQARWPRARTLLLVGGACALGFLYVQLWAWSMLLLGHVTPVGNPAGSFFYLLTAMHGLHVAGGLVGWTVTARRAYATGGDPVSIAWSIALCARYWHFLLAVWVVLFAALGWLTPEVVAFICGTR